MEAQHFWPVIVYYTRNKLFGKKLFIFENIYLSVDRFFIAFLAATENRIRSFTFFTSSRRGYFLSHEPEESALKSIQHKGKSETSSEKNKIHTSSTDTEVEGRIAWGRFWDPFCFWIKRVFVCIDTGFPTGFPPTVAPNNVPPTS